MLAGIVIIFFGVQGIARLTAAPEDQRAAAYHFGVSLSEYRKVSGLMILGSAGVAAGLVVPALGIAAAVGLVVLMVLVAGLRLLCQDGALRVAVPLVVAVLTAGTMVW
ncbi:DoxX family protein [Actinoplanes sichuanensis]|uniref:DoxX family protein n=1 Tax=Actinoplanes sichuanensis TaxID=512349 RepID=A0ABW4AAQ4_9ACTN|nr:DoxX family protein [Actinoplanes sichuanensis]